MKYKIINLIFFLVSNLSGICQVDEFEEFQQEAESMFQQYLDDWDKKFKAYIEQENEAFEKFKNEVEGSWGAENFKTSTQKKWVEYSPNKNSRSEVNFEKGVAQVEVIIDNDKAISKTEINKKTRRKRKETCA